ncbi:dTDP-glucose 4,6-dehydratase [Nonomuraea sp. NPDC050556]|uniref:dTDP-glucose 4,6-dehydratase n=1 Tax=Nonomuraea sp. NPDC050556 TaxID=3364369 RepID=UPI00378EF72D
MKKILVTGGAGFIGSHFVRSVQADDVTVLDKLTYAGNLANLEGVRHTFVRGDICDLDLLKEVVPGHDLVVNFAAESHVDRSIDGAAEFVRTNVLGTQTLMQACLDAGTPKVVQVSTDEVYGSIDIGSWNESAPLQPRSPYAAAKAGGDLIARAYAVTHGLNVSITRCGNNYGPRQYPEKVIPLFVTNLARGRKVPLYGDGGNVRDWIHAEDHCAGIRLVADVGEPGEVYHIAGTAELSNLELTQRLLDVCGKGWDMVEHVTDRKGHDRRYSLDDSKLRALGYRAEVPFEQGLKDTVRWYLDNRDWWSACAG